MATITTPVYLEDAARTAGEVWTINGGALTIRTDTRWHANSPASMTGTLGNVTISSTLGGSVLLDGRDVRWLAYTGGSGNVPAVGTTVTRSGVSGSFLGVWASLTSAPTAVGAAMPATGFIKFKSVTAGPFTAGALTGIGATASGADVTGWIEVVGDQAMTFTVPRLGNVTSRGDWFYLANTTGAAGQILQVPTNGGGATTHAPGLWIETAPASNTYEYFPALTTATQWTTTALGTDARAKFVETMGNGQLRIGSDGTSNIGYVPPSGCRVRVPNVFLRQCTTGARATNAVPHTTVATRPDFTTTSSGAIDFEYAYGDWYFLFSQPYSVRLTHLATFDGVNISECATAPVLEDGGTSMGPTGIAIASLVFTSCLSGGTITDWRCHRGAAAASNGHDVTATTCTGLVFTRVQAGIVVYARSSGHAFSISQCSNLTFNQCRVFNGPLSLVTCQNVLITNHDHVDRWRGSTIATTPYYCVQLTSKCSDVLINGITFGLGGTIADVHPYNGLMSVSASARIRLRNCGTRSAMLSGGSANFPNVVFATLGNCENITVQRCYLQPTRTAPWTLVNSDKGIVIESVFGDFADAVTNAGLNARCTGGSGTNSVTGQTAVYGSHWGDGFTADTAGRVWWSFNEATAETAAYVTTSFGAGSGFTSAGNVSMANVNDYVIYEHPTYVKGHTAFQNTAPILTGTGTANHSFEYALDTGSGVFSAYQTLNGTNLSAETISPTVGFKMRLRVTVTTGAATNLVTYVRITTDSTLAAQVANLYPLDLNTLEVTGLKNPSEVRVFDSSSPTTEIAGQENVTSGTFTTQIDPGTYPLVNVAILSLGYQNTRILSVDMSEPVSLLVQQNLDRQYLNP